MFNRYVCSKNMLSYLNQLFMSRKVNQSDLVESCESLKSDQKVALNKL